MTSRSATGLVMTVVMVMTISAEAAIPFADGFETYPEGTTFLVVTNGWGADTNAVVVQTNTVNTGTQAARLPASSILSNAVGAAIVDHLWVDQMVQPSLGDPPITSGDGQQSIRLYFTGDGYVALDTTNGWDVCETNAYGQSLDSVDGQWVRISIHLDFAATNAAVFLDGDLLRQPSTFYGSATSLAELRYWNGNDDVMVPTNAFIDDVLITTNLPAGLDETADRDNDGVSEAEEIHLYGDTDTYHRPVLSVTITNVGSPSGTGGTVTPSGQVDVFPGATTNYAFSAYPAFIVSDVLTNNVSVGAFPGQDTRTASYVYANILTDTVVTVEFTYTGDRYVPSEYATIEAAVAASYSNDTIYVADGTYSPPSPLLADIPLAFLGNTNSPSSVIVNAPASGVDRDCFQVLSSDVSIRGFRMVGALNYGNAASNGWLNAGIMVGNNADFDQVATNSAVSGITNGIFSYNEMSGCSHGVYWFDTTNCVATYGAISGNTTGAWANATADARWNWWGNLTGPSGVGPGSGDPVGANVLYNPWLSDAAGSHLVHYVEAGEDPQVALDAASDGDYILVAAGAYAHDITVSNALTLIGAAFTLNGNIDFAAGGELTLNYDVTAEDLAVDAGAAASLTDNVLTVDLLTIGTDGTLSVSNGTLVISGLVLTGTFMLDDEWGTELVPQPIRYEESFEFYADGSPLDRLTFFGLGASDSSVTVQTNEVFDGDNAVILPMFESCSNAIFSTEQKIWSDWYVMPIPGIAPDADPAGDASLYFYFNTNGHVCIATNGGWDVCSTDAFDQPVDGVSNTWTRITLRHDFGEKEVDVLLGGRVLRADVPFIGTATNYNMVQHRNLSGGLLIQQDTYIDKIVVDTALPPDLPLDLDKDFMPDAQELHQFGDLSTWPYKGSAFRFM